MTLYLRPESQWMQGRKNEQNTVCLTCVCQVSWTRLGLVPFVYRARSLPKGSEMRQPPVLPLQTGHYLARSVLPHDGNQPDCLSTEPWKTAEQNQESQALPGQSMQCGTQAKLGQASGIEHSCKGLRKLQF